MIEVLTRKSGATPFSKRFLDMRSIRLLRSFLLCILISVVAPLPAVAQTETSFDTQKMDAYLDRLNQGQTFMGTVAIDSAGSDVYSRSLGFIGAQADTVMADGETVYRIGSITKTFTATMIVQLIDEGKLSLSTKLRTFYPGIPQFDRVTIEHLLRHQSGIPNFGGSTLPKKWLRGKPPTKQEKLDFLRDLEPAFDPGSTSRYSNTNYVMLEFIIEDVTGEAYADQLRERITEPLDLRRTYFGDAIDVRQNEAAAFGRNESRWIKRRTIDPSIPGGAGGIVSTPSDLTDFIHALFNGDLTSQELLDEMTTLQDGMGAGMYEIEYSGAFALGHKGGGQGFFSHLAYFPDRKVAVAYSANGLDYSRDDIFAGIVSIYFGEEFELPSLD